MKVSHKTKKQTENGFLERYKKLNSEQRRAVDTIDGPVLVVAGPGTGKTEILTLRIGNILQKTDTQPENILALTFTTAGATNMRRRLAELIGSSAYRVVIETFHSFCNDVIKNYPEYFEEIIGSKHVSEVESLSLISEIIERISLDMLRPWGEPLHYLSHISRKISELKREGVTSEQFSKLVKAEEKKFQKRDDLYHEKGAYKGKMKGEYKKFEKTIAKNLELSLVYNEYQKILREKRLYDWSDMIIEVLRALEHEPDLKLILQENHQYILVDEHQDTNNAQNKIIELLCDFHKSPNIFIVGDEKQAIFRFQGASIQNFYYFKKLYPKVEVIELWKNYRSGQNILDGAHSLIAGSHELSSDMKDTARIEVAEFRKQNHELYFVAEKIKNLIEKEKVSPEEISVLYRSNKEAFGVASALERHNVSYSIESDEDLLSEKYVRKILSICEALHHYGKDEYLISLFHIDEFNIDPLDAYRMIALSSKEKKSLYDLISASKNPSFQNLSEKMKGWVKISATAGLSEFLEKILRESGILNSMIVSKDATAFLGIERLFEEGKRIATSTPGARFADFMNYISVLKEHNIFIKRPKHNVARQAVRLMTAHGSKGLEFEYVFIINVTEHSFGEKADREHLPLVPSVYALNSLETEIEKNSIDDERRLFYVCLTRAKKYVCISYSSVEEHDKEILPSPFILEIRADRKNIIDTTAFEKNLQEHPDKLFTERKPAFGTSIDRDFIRELFLAHPMSVSALNNYLSCPWKYFYRNLLRIPSTQEKHQIYGTAMHSAVEDMWKVLKERDITVDFLTNSYKHELGLLGVLSLREFDEALTRGNNALSGWFVWAQPKITNPVLSEFKVPAVEIEKGIMLSGMIDKMEMTSEKKAIVTDYKTGKQKSRNDIEGKTKNSNGDIKRQLQFYKLLLSLYSDITMEKGIVEFLEPNESGSYTREEFQVSETEVDELKKTIIRVATEIINLEFWDKLCDDKNCEYCAYRKLLN